MNVVDRLRSDWPYAVAGQRLFYGWAIALVSTLGFLMSIPGQTMGMAVFADPFIEAFDLTRTQLSMAYLFGTAGSAFFLTRAGRWYDRFGARILIVSASLVLSITLVFIAAIDRIGLSIAAALSLPLAMTTFPLILLGYFGVRFAGQGVLTSASRNVLLMWFERRRGLVSGVRGVFVSLGFAVAPLVLAWLIDMYGWRGALLVMAAWVGVGFAAVALITVRDSPQTCGLLPDGGRQNDDDAEKVVRRPSRTLAQARRDPVFWVYALPLSMHALFGTAVTFHIVAIFAEVGRDRSEAFGYFIPSAVVSVAVNLIASTIADYGRLKPMLMIMLGFFLLGSFGLTRLETSLGYWSLVIGFGAGGGLWGVLSNLAYVRQFGTAHLGEISGLATSLMVFGSAIGPVVFSLANDWLGSFEAAALVCVGFLIVLLLAAVLVSQPRDIAPNARSSKQSTGASSG
ncbi:MAG: MFS transporter [Pseudomonadaceae bacterium]|nr:MFS transporter [Pseudomonadaceae bacterium]